MGILSKGVRKKTHGQGRLPVKRGITLILLCPRFIDLAWCEWRSGAYELEKCGTGLPKKYQHCKTMCEGSYSRRWQWNGDGRFHGCRRGGQGGSLVSWWSVRSQICLLKPLPSAHSLGRGVNRHCEEWRLNDKFLNTPFRLKQAIKARLGHSCSDTSKGLVLNVPCLDEDTASHSLWVFPEGSGSFRHHCAQRSPTAHNTLLIISGFEWSCSFRHRIS